MVFFQILLEFVHSDKILQKQVQPPLATESLVRVYWDPGGSDSSAWGQAEIYGGRNVTDRLYGPQDMGCQVG